MTTNITDDNIAHARTPKDTSAVFFIGAGCICALLNAVLANLSAEDVLRAHLGLGYGLQTLAYAYFAMQRHKWAALRLLQPSLLALCYIGFSIALGGWSFSTGNVVRESDLRSFYLWSNVTAIYQLISNCLLALYFVSLWPLRLRIKSAVNSASTLASATPSIKFFLVALMALYCVAVFAPPGYLSQIKTVLFAAILYVSFRDKLPGRWIIALALIVFAAAISFQDKREAIFAVIPLGIAALSLTPERRLNLPHIIFVVGGAFTLVALIVAMSILRGYGNYFVTDFWEALWRVPDYLQNSRFIAILGLNFETTYLFLHLHTAVAAVQADPSLMTGGSTYMKALFLGPIGELTGVKLDSIIQSYTNHVAPEFRAIGGSFIITSVGEANWNFGWGGPLALALIYFYLDRAFVVLIRAFQRRAIGLAIVGLTLQQFVLYYSRGSGLDILIGYLGFAVLLAAPLILALKALSASSAK